MTSFDPSFEHFRVASGYRNKHTDDEAKFEAFIDFVSNTSLPDSCGHHPGAAGENFVIQFVCHPNFQANKKEILYYYEQTSSGFQQRASLPLGQYKRGNSYKNFKSRSGHPKGLFYELNLYTKSGCSQHHTSRVGGSNYERDNSHDQNAGVTKGKHWLD